MNGASRCHVVTEQLESRTMMAFGDLDATFGQDGKVFTAFESASSMSAFARAVATTTGGEVFAAGRSQGGSSGDFAVVKYLSNGTPEPSFGEDGIAITDFDSGVDFAAAIALQADGKIVVAGMSVSTVDSGTRIALVRYNNDGTPDDTFGDSGLVLTSLPDGAQADSVAVLENGKILVGGRIDRDSGNDDFLIVRYNDDGQLDDTFGDTGVVTTDFRGAQDTLTDLIVLSDGRILAVGQAASPDDSADAAVAVRYLSTGELDPSFGTGGLMTYPSQDNVNFSGVAEVPGTNGGFVATILKVEGDQLARFHSDGTLDTSFAGDGTAAGESNEAFAEVAMLPSGKIAVTGLLRDASTSPSSQLFLMRIFNTDGTPDATFDNDGIRTDSFGTDPDDPISVRTNSSSVAVAVQADGKLVSAGSHFGRFAVIRYEAEPVTPPPPPDLPNLTAAFATSPVGTIVGRTKGSVRLTISNAGQKRTSRTVHVDLYLSADGTIDSGDTLVRSFRRTLALRANRSITTTLSFTYPDNLSDAGYQFLAQVDSTNRVEEANESDNSTAGAPFTLVQPFVDLHGVFSVVPIGLTPGKRSTLELDLTNSGNVTSNRRMRLRLFASPDAAAGEDIELRSTRRTVRLTAGATKTVRWTARIPQTLAAGAYFLVVSIDADGNIQERDETNNFVLTSEAVASQ